MKHIVDENGHRAGVITAERVVPLKGPSGSKLAKWLEEGVPGYATQETDEALVDLATVVRPDDPQFGLSLADYFGEIGWEIEEDGPSNRLKKSDGKLLEEKLQRIDELNKAVGTCKPGERADITGCTPASGDQPQSDPDSEPGSEQQPKPETKPEPSTSEATNQLSKLGSMSWDALKKAGAKVAHVEHIAKEWVTSKVGAAVAKLPPTTQKLVRGTWIAARVGLKTSFATYTAGQYLAEKVARANGLNEQQAAKVKAICSIVDVATYKPVMIGTAAIGGPTAGLVGSFFPIGSLTYLAYGGSMLTWKKAKAAIGKVLSRKKAVVQDDKVVDLLAKRIKQHVQGDDDTYMALVLTAFDETKDLREAIAAADEAMK